MLVDFHTTLLLPGELATYGSRLVEVIEDHVKDNPYLVKVVRLLKNDVVTMKQALGRVRESEFTEILLEKDTKRDNSFVAFRDFAKACTRRDNETIATAANLICDIIKRHSWTLYSMNYADQTTTAGLMIEAFSKPEAADALKTIGAESWFEDVKTTQADFETAYQTKISEEAKKEYPLLNLAKANLIRHLKYLLNSIEVLEELDGSEAHAEMIERSNEIITDAMTTARARQTREENEFKNLDVNMDG